MRSTVTARGQTVVPAEIRKHFRLSTSDSLEWLLEDNVIRVIPVARDVITAFRGRGRGDATQRLLIERKKDRAQE